MKKIIQILFITTLCITATNCTLFKAIQLGRGEKTLTIEASSIVCHGLQGNLLRFEIPLRLANENDGEIRVKQVQVFAKVNGQDVFSFTRDEEIVIGSKEGHKLVIPLDIKLPPITEVLTRRPEELEVKVKAIIDAGMFGDREVGFETKQKLQIPQGPPLKLEKVSLLKSNLTKLRLNLRFKLLHPEDKMMQNSTIAGTVYVNGSRIGTFKKSRAEQTGKNMNINIEIPTTTAVRITRQVAKAKEFDVKIEALFEAELDNMKYRIPYTFEKNDIQLPKLPKPPPPPWKKKKNESGE